MDLMLIKAKGGIGMPGSSRRANRAEWWGRAAMLLVACCSAPGLAAPDLHFERLSLEDGLSQSSIYALAEDELGFMWFGTEQGADRYDGYRIQSLSHASGQSPGLSHSRVRSMHSDAAGRLWIGTLNGLNRVDPVSGRVLERFEGAVEGSAVGDFVVEGIHSVCTCRLVLLTNQGVWLIDPDSSESKRLAAVPQAADLLLSSLHVTHRGEVWLANQRSLWRLDCATEELRRVELVDVEAGFSDSNGPNLLTSLPSGALLWASASGLWVQSDRGNGDGFQRIAPPATALDAMVWAIHVDHRGRLWAMLSDRVVQIEGASFEGWRTALEVGPPEFDYRMPRLESAVSGDGVFWLAGNFGLAAQLEAGQRLVRLRHDPQRSSSLPPSYDLWGYRIKADRFGVLWIGTNLGGVAKYVPEQHRFEHVREKGIGTGNIVRGLVETVHDGREWVWVGLENDGVRIYERAETGWALIATLSSDSRGAARLPNNRIYAMAHDPGSNDVWVLGREWLVRIQGPPDAPSVIEIDPLAELAGAQHLSLSPDGQTVFVSAVQGVWRARRSDGFAKLELAYPTPRDGRIRENFPILPLSSGRLAVGSQNGLSLIDPDSGRLRRLWLDPAQADSARNFVFSLHESPDGYLWLGTHNEGLARVAVADLAQDSPAIEWWTRADSLADDSIYAILGDGDGCVWLSSNRGISRLCPDSDPTVRNFSLRDGLQAYEFNGRSAATGPSGRFYFGGINGFNVFRPEAIDAHPEPPRVHLESLRINEQPVDLGSGSGPDLSLRHRENTLEIDYVGLHSVAPEAIRYAYRLIGVDRDWVAAGTVRRARYPGLPPGGYRFEVRAANPDGVWSEPKTLLAARVSPPPWRTVQAKVAYVVLLVGLSALLVASVRRRRRQLEALVEKRTEELALRTRELAAQNETVTRQADELEALLDARQNLYANVSHELRTPLTLIHAALGRLQNDPRDEQALEMGERYVQRLDRLVDQLLDLARVRVDAFQPEERPWSLNEALQQLAGDYRAAAESEGLQLDLVLEAAGDTRCNRELVDKALGNLISNAIKYTPRGGQIVLRLTALDDRACIDVSDTGPGIPLEEQVTIFDRFHRVPAEEAQAQKGAGIGLALVHEAAVAMGGEIHLDSQPGQGSRFSLVIPATAICAVEEPLATSSADAGDEPAIEQVSTADSNPQSSPIEDVQKILGRLLIVEDNRDLQAHLKGLLSLKWNVITAADGQEALACLESHDIDVILSDIMMPRMDGLELLRRIRGDLKTSHIPFLILTARRDAETRLQGLRLAADAILAKPFQDEELRLTLENAARALEQRCAHIMEAVSQDKANSLSQADQQFVLKVERWLEENYSDSSARISQLAAEVHVDERTLQRKCRALMGDAPKSLLIKFRLKMSCELLRETNRKISEVAYECGFSSASGFSSEFSKGFGCSPSEWRKNSG